MKQFLDMFHVDSSMKILDVGGTPFNWNLIDESPHVVLANLGKVDANQHSPVVADGCFLPFKDNSFDVVFSNSVIEHIQGKEKQQLFANEVARVGSSFYVQTPNRYFFIEPHLLTPFIHWLPKKFQNKFVKKLSIRAILTRILNDKEDDYLDDVFLLNSKELMSFFPESRLISEKFLGMTKSLIVVYNPPVD
jgi:predicted SAM-dependent methyltransferase